MDRGRADRFVGDNVAVVQSLGNTHSLVTKSLFTSVKEALEHLDNDLLGSNSVFKSVWKKAIEKFRADYGKDPSSDKDKMTVSIIAYTLGPPEKLYNTLNEELRKHGSSGGNWDAFPFKGWWLLLHRALVNIPTTPEKIKPLERIPLYRGSPIKYRFSTTLCAAFGCLTSTTTSLDVAKEFIGPTGKGTLFEIDGIPMGALGIQKYSAFPEEEEVLLYPFSSFQVKEVKEEGPITRVKLSAAGPVVGYNFQA